MKLEINKKGSRYNLKIGYEFYALLSQNELMNRVERLLNNGVDKAGFASKLINLGFTYLTDELYTRDNLYVYKKGTCYRIKDTKTNIEKSFSTQKRVLNYLKGE